MQTVTAIDALQTDLDQLYALTPEHVAFYRSNGFIKLKQVLSSATLAHYARVIDGEVRRRNRQTKSMEERTTYDKAFLQINRLWEDSDARGLVFSRKLARIAAELMGVDGVRLYHDQALYKEPGGGPTPWHCDQFYWPLVAPTTCTAWIPFQAVPLAMGPLAFGIGSHQHDYGRHLPIGDESEAQIARELTDKPQDEGPFDLGEVSFHAGWTFHHAAGNRTDRMRAVMTVIYMEDGIRIAEPKHAAQCRDLAAWLPGQKPGEVAASALNPLLYRR